MTRKRSAAEKLTPQQRKAAELIVANQFGELEGERKRPLDDIAEEVGIARSTLFEWKRKREFIDYMNEIAHTALDAFRTEWATLLVKAMRGGNNGVPSTKALQLYAQAHGILKEHVITEDITPGRGKPEMSDEEVAAAMERIAKVGK